MKKLFKEIWPGLLIAIILTCLVCAAGCASPSKTARWPHYDRVLKSLPPQERHCLEKVLLEMERHKAAGVTEGLYKSHGYSRSADPGEVVVFLWTSDGRRWRAIWENDIRE